MADTFPELTITLADYQPHKRNYNRHPASQIERLRASLRKFGQPRNIVVWRKYFVAGHGVAQAAMAEGWQTLRANEIPADWPETRVMAFLAADNELSRLSDPDQAALAALIDEARQFDGELLTAIGYDDKEFDELLKEVGKSTTTTNGDAPPQVDRADELRKLWQVEPGQLWRIGDHRLVCGDCTDAATVARVMGGEKADLAWFDPPFGIDLKPQRQKTEAIENDGKEDAQALWRKFLPILKSYMSPDTHLFLCQGWSEFDWTLPLVRQHFFIKSKVVWSKNVWGIGYYTRPKHEDILYCWNGNPPTIDEPVADVWDIARENAPIHAAEKPPELSSIAIEHFSKASNIVVDWFAGVGGSMIACQHLQRKARAIELSPAYCSVILQRMADAFPGIEIERLNG